MKQDNKDKTIQPAELPQSEVFIKKEIYQQKQPADTGLPLDEDLKEEDSTAKNKKENEKVSKEEGLNEAASDATAGAFEGFENHSK
ncbi:MAG: hypothetical protein JWR61_3259 [Ferruginibacter sp.]|uniref:hypothetical protein n=1 Tax=Ferruginibacter sp. TaxID=1940288 RepID=UPI00265A6992|nr:hypothetical protein [Ferruginibacter sp.]MDB5278304.1 hypothetical protein [Ferruginibacter sp.]